MLRRTANEPLGVPLESGIFAPAIPFAEAHQ
jgi:hypothetical protein